MGLTGHRSCASIALLVGCALALTLSTPTAWALSTTVGGRTIELDGAAEIREVFETNRATGHDRTLETLRLRGAAQLTDWLRLDTTTVGVNGGPTFQATKSGTFNLNDTFQDVSPAVEFEEAYLNAHFEAFDLQVGKQKFAWGKLDRQQPNDLINPERFVDPLLQEEDERKIGVPAIQASYSLPARDWLPDDSRFTVVYAPIYVPFRFPNPGERWFPPAATPADVFSVPAGLFELGGQPNPAFAVPVRLQTINAAPPARQFQNSDWAARWSGVVRGADVALYYYHGFDPTPAFSATARAFAPPDPSQLPNGITAETLLSPVFRTIDAWGTDAAYTWGGFTFRGEGAYVSGRPFSRDLRFLVSNPSVLAPQIKAGLIAFAHGIPEVPIDLGTSFVVHDAVEWGVGADYTVDGYFLLLQANQTDVLHNDIDLLIKNVDTRLLANLRKNFLSDDLQAQLIGVYGIESDYSLLSPRLTYRLTDAIDARVGYLFIAGRSQSVGGQYKRNDEGFLRLRYVF